MKLFKTSLAFVTLFSLLLAGCQSPTSVNTGSSDSITSVTSVALSPTSLSLTVGGATGVLTANVAPTTATTKTVKWTTSDTGVATVSSTGVVTPVAVGTATITVKTTDGSFTATASVTVGAASSGNGSTVSGTLNDESGNPVPAFEITVLETGAKTTTAADGTFSLTLADGTYHLHVTTDWSESLSELLTFRPKTVVKSDGAIGLGSWTSERAATLGRAMGGEQGFPGVKVTIASLSSPSVTLATAIATSDEAMFAFFDLPEGEYLVNGTSETATITQTQIKVLSEVHNGKTVLVTNIYNESSYETYDFYLEDSAWSLPASPKPQTFTDGIISGTLMDDSSGDPLPSITLRLLDAEGVVVATATSDMDGNFEFTGLTYVTVDGTDYQVNVLDVMGYLEYLETVNLSSGSRTKDVYLEANMG